MYGCIKDKLLSFAKWSVTRGTQLEQNHFGCWRWQQNLSLTEVLGYAFSFDLHCFLVSIPELAQVEPNAHRIEEHRRKYERLHKEREEKKKERERQRRRAEAQVTTVCVLIILQFGDHLSLWRIFMYISKAAYEKAKKQEESSSSRRPGGMPGGFPGGIPGGFPGGMPGGFPGGAPGGVPGNVDFSKILNVSIGEAMKT